MKTRFNINIFLKSTIVVLLTILSSNLTVFGNSYGFDYKFMTSVDESVPRDPEIYIPQKTNIEVTAKSLADNNGMLPKEDVTVTQVEDDYDYTTSTIGRNTTYVLKTLKPITGSKFEESLKNWDSAKDVFSYSIKDTSNGEYIDILVKNFSCGIDITQLFDMKDIDILELNTEQEHGYETSILMRENSVTVALTPKVKNPGNYEFLVDDSVIVVIHPEGSVTPLTINSSALSGSLSNILSKSEWDKPEDLVLTLQGSLTDAVGVETEDDTVDETSNSTSNEYELQEPLDFIQDLKNDLAAERQNSDNTVLNSNQNYIDQPPISVHKENSNDDSFFSTMDNYENVSNKLDTNLDSTLTDFGYSYDMTDDMAGYEQVYNVWVDGKEVKMSEIPEGYYIEVDDEGRSVLKKRQLDLSGIQFGRSWGVINKLDGDNALKFANVDTTGNSLLKNVGTQMRVNVDTLTGHNIRTFYEKPTPVRYHPLQKSDRIVIVHGKYNWVVSIICCCISVILSLMYFIMVKRYVSKRLAELKRNYLIKDAEMAPDVEAVDLSSMQL